jgi:hypothetical protein
MIKGYDDFFESEKVSLDKETREYSLTHLKDAIFQLRSKDLYKEFSVIPYKKETLDKLKSSYEKLLNSLDSMNPNDLYNSILETELVDYSFGNVFPSDYTLISVPDLVIGLDDEQRKSLTIDEKSFLLNSFSSLSRTLKDEILSSLQERAEILCCIIQALFYYIRTIDKENFYQGLSQEEILEEYEELIEKSSKEVNFSFEGPYDSIKTKNAPGPTTILAFWECEKDRKKFFIRATILPSELYAEENISKTQGLKFSIVTLDNETPEGTFSYFNVEDLSSRIREFIKKIK